MTKRTEETINRFERIENGPRSTQSVEGASDLPLIAKLQQFLKEKRVIRIVSTNASWDGHDVTRNW